MLSEAKSLALSAGDEFADDQRLEAWPRPEYFRDRVGFFASLGMT